MTDEKNQFYLRNLVIPIEVALNKKLNKNCCGLFALIEMMDNSLNHCHVSSNYLANILGITIKAVHKSLSVLTEQGYIDHLEWNGNYHTIRINPSYKDKFGYLKIQMDSVIEKLSEEEL